MTTRREFLAGTAATAALSGFTQAAAKPTILLRSGWQTVNIGDIAHTPGMLRILQQYLPECNVILWPNAVDRGVQPMLEKAFPNMRVMNTSVSHPGDPALRDALSESHLLLHGSAASISSRPQFQLWKKKTNKPFGFYGVGVTLDGKGESAQLPRGLRDLVDEARFVYTRETASLENLKTVGAKAPVLGFAPDATFSMDLLDEVKADAYIREHKLTPGKFMVAVPRLRYTPYHLIRKVDWSPEELQHRVTVNDQYKKADHAKMQEAITAWVRKTGNPAVICPEMTYQIDIMDELVYDPLPSDVKEKVIRRKTFWLPDEASSFYGKAASVLSYECHSPILAVTQGTPCFYVHQPEDGIKGHMWNDVGLGDWYFEMDQSSGEQLADALLKQYANFDRSKIKALGARELARRIHRETAPVLRRSVGLSV